MSLRFTIGCDPELIYRNNSKFVHAYNYLKANSSSGLDGCESTAETRPGCSCFKLIGFNCNTWRGLIEEKAKGNCDAINERELIYS